jgi:general secretion pathway protein D
MKRSVYVRFSLSLLLVFAMISPIAALALGDGKKHFSNGMKHEVAEKWDEAVEAFALAVNENPKNPEYRLHLTRALFNASQMYMKKGKAAADEKDYQGAFIAFRKAYAYDPVNELAKSEMARMVRLQEELNKANGTVDSSAKGVSLVPTGYAAPAARPQNIPVSPRIEELHDVIFKTPVDLTYVVSQLAEKLDLNVLYDTESRLGSRKVTIDLKQVTAGRALDYLFLQENLFFQKVGPRTILIATGNRRTNFQQLVLRTFYLANAKPADVQKVIQQAIPAQPGRSQTGALIDESTNSITIRDTEENVRLISKLISSLDKDRAEVVMDVSIYEVSKADLLQFGNQLGTTGENGTLLNLGGFGLPKVWGGRDSGPITGGMPFPGLDVASIAFGLPLSQIRALQNKSNTKLIANTQIHAFNNEDSSARIGQRVPVRTASFAPVANNGTNNPNNNFVGDVINYEQVGLTLKFKPIVFPNHDVQVAMEIESKDVGASSEPLIPVFTERTIKGTARVQNNKTLLLASVAQNTEIKSRSGLPLLGLIPIIGRLFTAPTKDNRQTDIVIAITPRVIRAPAILPEDEIERPTGSLATPTNSSLEAMVIEEDREEFLASARRLPNTAQVQLPDQPADSPAYVRTTAPAPAPTTAAAATPELTTVADKGSTPKLDLKPIDSTVKTLDILQTADRAPAAAVMPATLPTAQLSFAELPEMKKGQKAKILVRVDGTSAFRSAVLGLKYDEQKLSIRSVTFGDVFGPAVMSTKAVPFLNQGGKTFVSLSLNEGVAALTGTLAVIEVEARADGKPVIEFDRDVLNFLTADGKNFAVKF